MQPRELTPDDWPDYREIRLRALADAPDAFGSTLARELAFTEADWRVRLESRVLLIEQDGRSVSMGGSFDNDEVVLVWTMWTDPVARGRGHAMTLLHALLDGPRAAGRRIELDVNPGMEPAYRVYERFGFRPTGAVGVIRDGSAIPTMHLALPADPPGGWHSS